MKEAMVNSMKEAMVNRRRRGLQLPDAVYLVLETAIDEIMVVFEEEQENIRPPAFHMLGREFQLMLRDREREFVMEKIKKSKEDK